VQRIIALIFIFAAGLLAQTRTMPLTGPDGKPVMGKDGKPATITVENITTQAMADPGPPNVPPDKVIIAVDDEKVTAGELEAIIQVLPEQVRGTVRGAGRRQFAEQIVRVKLLAREARRKKLDQTPAYKLQAAFQDENLLASVFYMDMMKAATVDEAAARAYYDGHKAEYERVKARHILVRMTGSPVPIRPGQEDLSDAEAKTRAAELRQKIVDGGDFAAVATAESDDPATAAKGGDVGLFARGQMVPSFEQAAYSLPVGFVSEPVRSQFGYHIIRVESREPLKFEDLRASIEQRMRPQLAQKTVDEMRKSAAITIDPGYFGEEPKPAAAPPQPQKP
jgi:peptidyl-prolyl cis-trans isomerase C